MYPRTTSANSFAESFPLLQGGIREKKCRGGGAEERERPSKIPGPLSSLTTTPPPPLFSPHPPSVTAKCIPSPSIRGAHSGDAGTHRDRDRHTGRGRGRDRDSNRDSDRGRGRHSQRHGHVNTHTHTHTHTHTYTHTHKHTPQFLHSSHTHLTHAFRRLGRRGRLNFALR